MHRNTALLAAVTALALAGTPLAAQSTLDTTFTVRGTPRVAVNNLMGTITVRSWSRDAVRVQAEYEDAQVRTDVSPARIVISSEHRRGGDHEVEYVITVPAGTPLELSGTTSDVRVQGVCGPVTVSVTAGDVDLDCLAGLVSVNTVAGDVMVRDVRSGSVDITGTAGDIGLARVRAPVTVHSAAGDVTLDDVDAAEVSVETVSGEISFYGPVRDNGRYRLEAHSGDITMRVANTFNASVSVSTFSGEFEPDFPITVAPGRHSSRDWQFTVGNASARVTLRSFSGTIQLRRGAARGGRDREEEQP